MFITHLNSPGSISSPAAISGAQNYSDTQAFIVLYQVPPTYSWVERVHVWAKCLAYRSTTSELIYTSAHPWMEPATCCLQVAHAATEPRRPTHIHTIYHIPYTIYSDITHKLPFHSSGASVGAINEYTCTTCNKSH